MNPPHRCLTVAFCISLGILGGLNQSAIAQQLSVESRLSDPVYVTWISNEAVGQCVVCHVTGLNFAQFDSGKSDEMTAFSRREEMMLWMQQDKHAIARRRVEPLKREQLAGEFDKLLKVLQAKVNQRIETYEKNGLRVNKDEVSLRDLPRQWIGLSNVLSRRICDKLWGDGSVETEDGYNKFRDHCLTCHGGFQGETSGFRFEDAGDDQQIGIDCLYCHQSGNNNEWVDAHDNPKRWRLKPPNEKLAAGMNHLVDTSNQARLCMDCHVGNHSKRMFVTHKMYAAGHPPLPSIEVQEFSSKMPQHWQTPAQLYQSLSSDTGRDEYFKVNYPGLTNRVSGDKIFWLTRKMLIGSLVARRHHLNLLIQSDSAAQPDEKHWADYSLYDCTACHHELKTDSRRQTRSLQQQEDGFTNPGRPRQHEWTQPLLEVAYRMGGTARRDELDSLERELRQCFSDRPFGDADRVMGTAAKLGARIDELIELAQRQPLTSRISNGVLLALTKTPENKLLSYDSSRQLVWAIETIADELQSQGTKFDDATLGLITSLGDPAVTGIDSSLPSGRRQFIYPESLQADLKRRATFDVAPFLEKLSRLRSSLASSTTSNRSVVTAKAGSLPVAK